MMKEYYRMRFRERKLWVVLVLLAAYNSIDLFFPSLLKPTGWFGKGVFDFFSSYYEDVFNIFGSTFICIPLYIVFVLFSQTFFLNYTVRFRFAGNRAFWNRWLEVMAIDACSYVGYQYLLLFGQFAVSGHWSALHGWGLFLLEALLLQTLTYFLMDMLFCAVTFLYRNNLFGAAVVYSLVLIDFVVGNTNPCADLKFFLRTIRVDPFSLNSFYSNLLMLAGLTVGAFLLLPIVSDHVECLGKEAS